MLYIYLSHTNRQVILPTAVKAGPEAEDGPLVSFVDEHDNVVAVFLRADVGLYSTRNLGRALEQVDESQKSQTCC
jgi:hypothetical protein